MAALALSAAERCARRARLKLMPVIVETHPAIHIQRMLRSGASPTCRTGAQMRWDFAGNGAHLCRPLSVSDDADGVDGARAIIPA